MRVFGIKDDERFSEYVRKPFQAEHEEKILEEWLESNPDGIVEDGRILNIGRQVTTNLGGLIDLIGLDREGDVVVVELKRDRTPRDTIAQSLEYASFAEKLDSEQLEDILRAYLNDDSLTLAEYHREYFELETDEAVAFNKDQRIVIVGQNVTPEVRQSAAFLRSKGIRVTCVEFTFFQADGGTRLLSQEIVVGKESGTPDRIAAGFLPVVTEEDFIQSLDENGRAVFSRILEFAKAEKMPVHWGTKGFSLNVDVEGEHVALCFIYPPDSVYKQTFRTTLHHLGGVERKTAVPEEVIQELRAQAEKTGLFRPAGRELKAHINRSLTEAEIDSLVRWCGAAKDAVSKYGLKE